MRVLFFLLLFANLLFFAYGQGYFGQKPSSDAHRLEKQVNPERLRLTWLPDEAPADAALPPSEVTAAPAVLPSAVATVASVAPVPSSAPVTAAVCIRINGLAPDDAVQLAGQATILRLKATQLEANGWWVFIPPLADRAAAEKKAAELTQLGIRDFFIANNGAQQFAISLGIFSSEESAHRHLEELRGKGVRSARVGPRRLEKAQQSLEIRGDPLVVTAFRGALPADATTSNCP
ncbi:MAG: SPOR domain-containing protein [Zoogloeaceae bacterium]|nr:SPOR domain-containing protein [Zoogloeaceae bacterium]